MPVASKSIVSITPHTGKFRARFLYTLDDGREFERTTKALSLDDANAKLLSFEAELLTSIQERDTDEAINNDVNASYGEATAKQVKLGWLKKGFNQQEAYRAYFFFKKVMPELLALGKTDTQLSVILDTSVAVVVELKEKWAELSVNAVTLDDYIQIQGGF